MAAGISSTVIAAARQHIEDIRRSKFSIGAAEPNPLTEDLHHAVKHLSAELYSKDVHFLMELIQNAEDNEYPNNVKPSLEFVITSEDITGNGSSATLLVFNNEVGFSRRNIESVCSVGRSTKKGRRQEGFIGEKGIGFKSVFLVTSQPYVFSNGYQINFTEEPDPCCGIGYIVPSWVDKKPSLLDIVRIYGSGKTLPTTVIILPLRSEKLNSVKQQLSSIHPELLLFLSKIKQLSVREIKIDANVSDSISAISISSETYFRMQKGVGADSHIVYLSAQGGINDPKDCHYYMWKQRFPVKSDCRVVTRKEIDEWVITLAFPFGDRLRRGSSSAGIYAFLPTEMVTDFPFTIQADFILASSRETILLDNKWNQGILDCVPNAFVHAFTACVRSVESVPISSIAPTFKFLPLKASSFAVLNRIREDIKTKMQAECIIPCESFMGTRVFSRPRDVGRILPAFRNILLQLEKQKVSLEGVSSHGKYVLHSDMDVGEYNSELNFLGIENLSYDWYGKCIKGCNLVFQASEDLYLELLCFVVDNWWSGFSSSIVKDLPLIKYVDQYNKVMTISFLSTACPGNRICMATDNQVHAWLNKYIMEFGCTIVVFLPNSTQKALESFHRRDTILSLRVGNMKIDVITTYQYAKLMAQSPAITVSSQRVICFTHFLIQSLARNFVRSSEADNICAVMPVVDMEGKLIKFREVILVPRSGSKWVMLLGSNPWSRENYVELGEQYAQSSQFAGEITSKEMIQKFAKLHIKAADLPELRPPNASLPVALSALGKEQAFLLLEWLRACQSRNLAHNNFIGSIRNGSWLRTSSGFNQPIRSFLLNELLRSLISEMGGDFASFSTIDEEFYDNKISSYTNELKNIGVNSSMVEACQTIADNLLSHIENRSLTREAAVPILKFIRYMREKSSLSDKVKAKLQEGICLKTTQGYRPAAECILLVSPRAPFLQIVEIPIIDEAYYGTEIRQYTPQLEVLGISVDKEQTYRSIVQKCAFFPVIPPLTKEVAISLLEFVKHLKSLYMLNDNFLGILKKRVKLITPQGSAPISYFVLIPASEFISQITDLWCIDENYYGKELSCYMNELDMLGVITPLGNAYLSISKRIRFPADLSMISKDSVLLLMCCIKYIGDKSARDQLVSTVSSRPWLKTSLGFKNPSESFLSNPEWDSLLHIVEVPVIDTVFYGNSIQSFESELQQLGVTADFPSTSKAIAAKLKTLLSLFSLTKNNILSLLDSVKCLKGTPYSPVKDFKDSLTYEKWLRTTHGYKSATETVLLNSEWESASLVADLPFLDQVFYGNRFYLYRDELKMMGVIVDLEDGFHLIAKSLKLPEDATEIAASSVHLMMKCIRYLLAVSSNALPDDFLCRIGSQWLKTCMGYRSPLESFLFDSNLSSDNDGRRSFASILESKDVPFIDEEFYGTEISLYRNELRAIGVNVDAGKGLEVLADFLFSCAEFHVINRIYRYLYKFQWKPKLTNQSTNYIWVPSINSESVPMIYRIYRYLHKFQWKPKLTNQSTSINSESGEWVHPSRCVLSDSDDLFGSRINVLDTYYEESLLPFFSSAFGIKSVPSTDDYLSLWNDWEVSSLPGLTYEGCCAFWAHIVIVWTPHNAEILKNRITKLPAKSANCELWLVDKNIIFVADDLQLEQIFSEAREKPLFIWFPQPSMASFPLGQLYEIYISLGVKKISETVQKGDDFCRISTSNIEVDSKAMLIGRGLISLVLGFLADPSLDIPVSKKHELARSLVDLDVLFTQDPITVLQFIGVQYRTFECRGKKKMVSWEKDSKKLIVQKPEKSSHESMIEFAFHFARAVSEGLLWEYTNLVESMSKLIQSGCAYEFDFKAMKSLLTMENLQVFEEDVKFLDSAFTCR